MNRLTRVEISEVLIKNGWKKKDTESYTSICYGCDEIRRCVNRCGFYKAFEKLAKYEDTALGPEDIEKICSLKLMELVASNNLLNNELKRYKELEKQGLLIKLLCKVGDDVYLIHNICNGKWTTIEEVKFNIGMYDCFNKTVFLTREEAEKAMKEMKI